MGPLEPRNALAGLPSFWGVTCGLEPSLVLLLGLAFLQLYLHGHSELQPQASVHADPELH